MNYEKINSATRHILNNIRLRKSRLEFKRNFYDPQLFSKPLDEDLEKKYIALWSKIYKRVSLAYLRVYCHKTGIMDHRFVPMDIYRAFMERIMNDPNSSNYDMDKNRLDLILGKENCPEVCLKKNGATYLDGENRIVTPRVAEEIFQNQREPLMVKPSKNTRGGKNVMKLECDSGQFVNSTGEIFDLRRIDALYFRDYIIQRVISQHRDFASFNSASVNTVRIHTYRSVRTEEVHCLYSNFLCGRKDSIVSNNFAGGYAVNIENDGTLSKIGIIKSGEYFLQHADSLLVFEGYEIPEYSSLVNLAKQSALRFPAHRMIGFDLTLDEASRPLVIEANITGVATAQLNSGPFLGDFTEEIVDYCAAHKYMDNFRVLKF